MACRRCHQVLHGLTAGDLPRSEKAHGGKKPPVCVFMFGVLNRYIYPIRYGDAAFSTIFRSA